MGNDAAQRYICIHGHFYQPPREDPWLEAAPVEDSAYPYHDWNQRVTAQCYAPNAWAHRLDSQGRVERIVSNYAHISFDFGPTLLAWMERQAPEVYRAILEADGESQRRYGGYGSAMAQAYNHLIMPLANARDKATQVVWGVRDFEHRFRRKPEGMWLPETAVDLETLEVMAQRGIVFTLLEPSQATAVRPLAGGPWQDVRGGGIATSQPYTLRLPSGRGIALFFYSAPIARGVAFEGLLHSGEALAGRLATAAFAADLPGPQLVHVATDGESYGHHHRFGEMALAYALEAVEQQGLGRLTNYGQYLEIHPPAWEVQIAENTSWSCRHGVERWRSDCGCRAGASPAWGQGWRAPLREALDWLRDALAPWYEGLAGRLLQDPWAARDDYISVVLDRSLEVVDAFLQRHARGRLSKEQRVAALKLLEMQRHAMLMFTSCGWFFDEPSRIETVQVLKYAARAIQLGRELTGDDLEPAFLKRLAGVKSNLPEQGDGRRIYERYVTPHVLDWDRVAAHYAVASLHQEMGPSFYSYAVQQEDLRRRQGRSRRVMGRASFVSKVTAESMVRAFVARNDGNLVVKGRVATLSSAEYAQVVERLEAGQRWGMVLGGMGGVSCTLDSLFEEEHREVLAQTAERLASPAEALFRRSSASRVASLKALAALKAPVPESLRSAAGFFLGVALRRAMRNPVGKTEEIRGLVAEAQALGARLDAEALGYEFGCALARGMAEMEVSPQDLGLLEGLAATAALIGELPFPVHVAEAQNRLWRFLRSSQGMAPLKGGGAGEAERRRDLLVTLAEALGVAVG